MSNFEEVKKLKKGKNFFDMPDKDKRAIIEKAAHASNVAQRELIDKYKNLKAWDVVSIILKELAERTVPGANLVELDKYAEKRIKELGGTSINKGYRPKWAPRPFPAVVCTSVNFEIAHGFPFDEEWDEKKQKMVEKPRILKQGDVVSYDLGVMKDGLAGDACLSVNVGVPENKNERLFRYAKRGLYAGIKACKPGAKIGDIGKAIEKVALIGGYVINTRFSGHGIGKEMHEDPLVCMSNIDGITENELEMKVGWKICIEPIFTYKDRTGMEHGNGWTYVTRDFKNNGFFEHMVEITEDGCKILTSHIQED
jgi:methionyl aminopeptidase